MAWLEATTGGAEAVGIPNPVYSAFIRIATNPNLSQTPLGTSDAFAFCEQLRNAAATVVLQDGPRHWEIFEDLVLRSGVRGPHVADAYLAAFAIENNATFVTFDRGFTRFPGLKVLELP